ncbi:MAG: hypothetical protein WBE58_22410, partial [Verrucomicrobiales bacterium]
MNTNTQINPTEHHATIKLGIDAHAKATAVVGFPSQRYRRGRIKKGNACLPTASKRSPPIAKKRALTAPAFTGA